MNKVWTYVIGKQLSQEQLKDIQALGEQFVSSWTAHENKLAADFVIFKERIIIIRTNEDVHSASGCSIDKLVRFIKELQSQFNIELLNRLLVAYQSDEKVEVVNASSIKNLLSEHTISENTVIYNTALSSETELLSWEQPLKNTWLKKYLVEA